MLRIQMIGLAIVAVLAMGAVAAGSASAAEELPHEWLLNGLLIAAPVKIHSLFLVLLTDHNPPGGEVVVHCKGFNDGTVGPHELDLVLAVTTELLKGSDKIPCTFDKQGACESGTVPLALALNLPWHTELTLFPGSEVRDMIMGDGNGNPGWSVTCKTILGTITDDCTAPLGSTRVENIAGGGVLALFDKISNEKNPADCKVGGEAVRKAAGLVSGDITLHSPSATLPLSFH
jgi:hypothetical protein